MSENIKNSFISAAIVTAIIAILLIIFGNTGTGIFNNIMVFTVGTLIGTPLAAVGKFIGSIFKGFHEAFEYIGLIVGALIGVSFAVLLFSNKLETSFMYNCVKNDRGTKTQCECVYSKVTDAYEDDALQSMLRNPSEDYIHYYLNSHSECEGKQNSDSNKPAKFDPALNDPSIGNPELSDPSVADDSIKILLDKKEETTGDIIPVLISGDGESCKLWMSSLAHVEETDCISLTNSKNIKILCTKKKKICKTEREIYDYVVKALSN